MMSCTLKDASTCTYLSESGVEYVEFSCLYKELEPFYLEFEKCFDSSKALEWAGERPAWPAVAVATYAVCVFFGKRWMEDRKPFNWKFAMGAWNLFLCAFSFVCVVRVLPHALHNLSVGKPRDLLCVDPETTYGHGSTGLWITLFVASKFVELIDTLFIVAHKKPLMLLHWYHHMSVLVWSWYSFVTRTPSSIIFLLMNASVHTIMYAYYFLTTIRMRPDWLKPKFVTVVQLAQMAFGFFVTAASTYYTRTQTPDNPCDVVIGSLAPCYAMYGSYFALFLRFFLKRYRTQKRNKKEKEAKSI